MQLRDQMNKTEKWLKSAC